MNQKLFLLLLIYNAVNVSRSDLELNIIHLNDIHSHFLEIKDDDHMCTPDDAKQGLCFGGIGRQVSMIKEIRKREKNVLVLSAGDFFMGTSYNPLHGFRLASIMLPYLGLNATALGNHAFDTGFRNAAAFILTSKCPVVCCNLIGRNGSFWEKYINKSTVLHVGGEKVGIVGFIHPNTAKWARTGVSMHFVDELPCLREEVKKLQDSGVNKIIALGHSSLNMDKNIASNVSGIDVVVGGNSQVFLYNQDANDGTKPHLMKPLGHYPKVVHQLADGEIKRSSERPFLKTNISLIVQVPQHGKYLGLLKVVFDDKGRIMNFAGNPILLDKNVPKDAATEEELAKSLKILEDPKRLKHLPSYNLVLGNSIVNLTGGLTCRMKECNLGNLVTDAAMFVFDKRAQRLDWPAPDAAVWNSGGLRASIPAGNITMRNLAHAIYMGDLMKVWNMTGDAIKEMMENSVAEYDVRGISPSGAFLQVSGMQVIYDLSQPPHERVVDITLRCHSCNNTSLKSLNKQTVYKVAVPDYIRQGGDGFKKFGDDHMQEVLPDTEILKEYLQEFDPVNITTEKRIAFKGIVKDPLPKFKIRNLNLLHQLSNREIFQESNSTDKRNSSKLGQNITSNSINDKFVKSQLINLTNTDAHNSNFPFHLTMKDGNVAANKNQNEENNEFGGNVLGWPIFEDHFDDSKGDESQVVSDELLANIFDDDDIVAKEMVDLRNTTTEAPGSKDPKNMTTLAFNDSLNAVPMHRSFRHKTIKKDLSSLQNNIYTVRDQMFQGWPDWIFNPEILKPTQPLFPSFENQSKLFNLATLNRLGIFNEGSLAIKNALKIKKSKPEPPNRSIVFIDTQQDSATNNTASGYLTGKIVPASVKNRTNRAVLPSLNSSVTTTFAVTSHLSNESELNEVSTKENMATNLELNREKKAEDVNNSWASTNLPESGKFVPQVVMLDNERRKHDIKNMTSEFLNNTLENIEHDQNAEILHLAKHSNLNESIILSQDSNVNTAKVSFEEASTSKPSIKVSQTEKKHEVNVLNEDKDFQSLTNKWNAENSHIINEPIELSSVLPNQDATSKLLVFNDDSKQNVKQDIAHDEASTKMSFSVETANSDEPGIFHTGDTHNIISTKSITRRPISLNREKKLNTVRKNTADLNKNKDKLNGTDHNVLSQLVNATDKLMTTRVFAEELNTDVTSQYANIDNSKKLTEKSVESLPHKIYNFYENHSEPLNNSPSFHLTSKKPTKMENSAMLHSDVMLHGADSSRNHNENILMARNNATNSSEYKLQQENSSLILGMMRDNRYMSSTKPKLYSRQNLDYEKEHGEKTETSLPQEITNFPEIKLRHENVSSEFDQASEDVISKKDESSVPLHLMKISDETKKHAEEIIMAVTHKNNDSSEIKSTQQNNSSAFNLVLANSSAKGVVFSVPPKLMQNYTKKRAEKLLTSVPHKVLKTSENKIQPENDASTISLELLQNVDRTEKHAEGQITPMPHKDDIFPKRRKYNNDSSTLNSISENIHVKEVKPSLAPRFIEDLDYEKKHAEDTGAPMQHKVIEASENKVQHENDVSTFALKLMKNVDHTEKYSEEKLTSAPHKSSIFPKREYNNNSSTLNSLFENVPVAKVELNLTSRLKEDLDHEKEHAKGKRTTVQHEISNSSVDKLKNVSSSSELLYANIPEKEVDSSIPPAIIFHGASKVSSDETQPSVPQKANVSDAIRQRLNRENISANSSKQMSMNVSSHDNNFNIDFSINHIDEKTAATLHSIDNSSESNLRSKDSSTNDILVSNHSMSSIILPQNDSIITDLKESIKNNMILPSRKKNDLQKLNNTLMGNVISQENSTQSKDSNSSPESQNIADHVSKKSIDDADSQQRAGGLNSSGNVSLPVDDVIRVSTTAVKNLFEKSAEDAKSKDQASTTDESPGEKSEANTTSKNHLQVSVTDDQSPVHESAVSAKPKKHYHRLGKVDRNPWDFFRLIFWKSF